MPGPPTGRCLESGGRCPAKRRPGRECPAWVPSLPGKGPTGKGWGPRGSSSPRASRPGRGTAAELYLHNASTFSPGVTCGAIQSRPLHRRSWCAPLRLRAGRAPDTADAGQPRGGGDLALRRHTPGGRAPWRAGSRPPSFFPASRSADVSRSGPRRRGRYFGAGSAAGPRAPRPPFSAPAQPPGVSSRRLPPSRSGSTGLCPGTGPKPRPPALRPLGTGPPRALSRQTRRCTRAHPHSHTHTHTMPLRGAHSDSPALGFGAPCAILSFPLLAGGWVTSPRRPGSREERGSREGPLDSGRRAGPGPRREPPARRRWAGQRSRRRVGPRSPPLREREGGGRRRNEALGCSAAGTEPTVQSPRAPPAPPPPPPGARQVLSGPAPGPDPSLSRPPGSLFLSSSPSHVRAGCGFCPDFL